MNNDNDEMLPPDKIRFSNGGRDQLDALAWLREKFPLGAYVKETQDDTTPGIVAIVIDHQVENGQAILIAASGGSERTWTVAGVGLYGLQVVPMPLS